MSQIGLGQQTFENKMGGDRAHGRHQQKEVHGCNQDVQIVADLERAMILVDGEYRPKQTGRRPEQQQATGM